MEMTMKTAKLFFKTTCLFMAAILTGCTADVVQEEEKNKEPNPAATDITFTSENPSTRTSITHSIGNGATPFWSERDRIWVKDVNGTWQKSSEGKFSSDMSNGVFTFSSGTFRDNCEVHYTGANGTEGNKVKIANEQRQSKPNDFSHAGVSGDCGTGTAKGNGERFKFKLSHKASYICFLPTTSNKLLEKYGKLTKIEVISKDNIAGTFDFSNGVLSPTRTRTTDSDKKITLITGDGFSLDESTNIGKNGSYIVIAPGNHKLTVRYWLHYKTYREDITGTITKTFALNCEAGKIYDIKAKLDPIDYTRKKYYMWDAKADYWDGNEQYQPKSKYDPVDYSHFPNSVSDPRWYNEKTAFPNEASNKCGGCPNANEALWYIINGDPHWDSEELWVMYGYLYTGGMWFKKKSYISEFNSQKAPDGMNYTKQAKSAYHDNTDVAIGRPDDIEKCFYLPALGSYNQGSFYNIGVDGNYWTRTPTAWVDQPGKLTKGAYYLYFFLNPDGKKATAKLYGGDNRQKGYTWWQAE
ncbi:hypothetical protein [Prevotella intermedia]|nr:hypothetical protein [Prevotella intermedia]